MRRPMPRNAPEERKPQKYLYLSGEGAQGAGNRVSEIAVAGSFVAAVRLNRGERASEHVCGERKVNYVSLTNSRVSEQEQAGEAITLPKKARKVG